MNDLEIKSSFDGTDSTIEFSGELEIIDDCEQILVSIDNEIPWCAPDDQEYATAYMKESDAVKIIAHLQNIFDLKE